MSNSERFPAAGNGSTDEESPLLGNRKPPGQSQVVRVRKCLGQEINRDWADLVLLGCYVVTGLLDSASTQVWGAFVSMQTGRSPTRRPISERMLLTWAQEIPSMLDSASHHSSILHRSHVSGSPASPSSHSVSAHSSLPASIGTSPPSAAGCSSPLSLHRCFSRSPPPSLSL